MRGLDLDRDLSLYIHVPFCASKCDYCAFYSKPLSQVENGWIERYVSLVINEIEALNEIYQRPYYTLFIGGGNPGIIGWENLERIFRAATRNGKCKEATMEINPETLNDSILKLSPYLTRVSVGIQSLDEKALRVLGRNAKISDNLKALDFLSQSPFDWNADLITSIPGTTVERTLEDIEMVASYNPGHISLYSLTFEEGTELTKHTIPLGEDDEAVFLEESWKKLKALGYEHYEVSNFAKEGKRCLHNEVYWHLGQYVGFGPGAESSIGYKSIISMRENETLEEYLRQPELECTQLSEEEGEEEFLLSSLRTADGIDKGEYERRFSHSFDSIYKDAIETLDDTTYIDTPYRFSITEPGFMVLDRIILALALRL